MRMIKEQKSRYPVKRRVFSCKFSPQELMCHHSRLVFLDISGWDRFISSVMTQVMARLDSGPIRVQDGARQLSRGINRGLDFGLRDLKTCRKLRRVKRQYRMVTCNNNSGDNKPQTEGATLALHAVRLATRKGTSLDLGMCDLRQAMGLLVSLYASLTMARAPGLRVTSPSLSPASVQLATAAVLLRPGRGAAERFSYAASLLCILHLQLSSEAASRPSPIIGGQCSQSVMEARAGGQAAGLCLGEVTRLQAERRLSHSRPGTFLIRASESRASSLVLSVRSHGGCVHLKIEQRRGPGLQRGFVLGGFSPLFPDLASIVCHYSRHILPIRGHEGGTLLLVQPASQTRITCFRNQDQSRFVV